MAGSRVSSKVVCLVLLSLKLIETYCNFHVSRFIQAVHVEEGHWEQAVGVTEVTLR